MRSGIGYDIHRLVPGRPLILGGVRIEHPTGLLGHSDADVAVHAIMDALLGAAGLGDIGRWFPDSDPALKDVCSLDLLRRVRTLLEAHGWLAVNVDATIIAEEPRLAPHIPAMRERVAQALGVETAAVNIKATTNEGLGAVGSREGIAAFAVALAAPK